MAMNWKPAVLVGAIVVGVAVGASLFYLFPGFLFKGTGFEQQTGSANSVSPQSVTGGGSTSTASAPQGNSSTNSSSSATGSNGTSGSATGGYGLAP